MKLLQHTTLLDAQGEGSSGEGNAPQQPGDPGMPFLSSSFLIERSDSSRLWQVALLQWDRSRLMLMVERLVNFSAHPAKGRLLILFAGHRRSRSKTIKHSPTLLFSFPYIHILALQCVFCSSREVQVGKWGSGIAVLRIVGCCAISEHSHKALGVK